MHDQPSRLPERVSRDRSHVGPRRSDAGQNPVETHDESSPIRPAFSPGAYIGITGAGQSVPEQHQTLRLGRRWRCAVQDSRSVILALGQRLRACQQATGGCQDQDTPDPRLFKSTGDPSRHGESHAADCNGPMGRSCPKGPPTVSSSRQAHHAARNRRYGQPVPRSGTVRSPEYPVCIALPMARFLEA
jgi:hypothetical protein